MLNAEKEKIRICGFSGSHLRMGPFFDGKIKLDAQGGGEEAGKMRGGSFRRNGGTAERLEMRLGMHRGKMGREKRGIGEREKGRCGEGSSRIVWKCAGRMGRDGQRSF